MSSDMTRQRADIEGAIAGRTLCDELRQVAETSGDADAYSDEAGTGDGWRSLTWSQVRQKVLEVAAGFVALGLSESDAQHYAQHVEAGRTVVMVRTHDRKDEAVALLDRDGAYDDSMRAKPE